MAIFKKISAKGKYQDDLTIPNLITYITRPDKTPCGIIAGNNIDFNDIAGSMVRVSESYNKNSRIRAHHFIVSFMPHEIPSQGIVICIAMEICRFFSDEYQIVYALHEDTQYPHLHFVFNSISYIDGHRYRGGIGDYNRLYYYIRSVLEAFRIYNFHDVPYVPASGHPDE